VVIFRLRDRDEVGSTFIRTIEHYTRDLQDHGNMLMITGISQDVMEQLERTELLDLIGEENIFLGQPRFGAALSEAVKAAEAWVAQTPEN
jgi:SulP family sulfate permease